MDNGPYNSCFFPSLTCVLWPLVGTLPELNIGSSCILGIDAVSQGNPMPYDLSFHKRKTTKVFIGHVLEERNSFSPNQHPLGDEGEGRRDQP